MIITRKIQVYIAEDDKEQRKEFLHTLYQWRDLVRRAANIVVSHKFIQDNIKDFVYVKDEIKDKFYVKDILKEEKGMSEQNTTYRVLSEYLKGKIPSDIYSCLNQSVSNTYKETRKDLYTGKASLRSYKNNIPIPFSAKAISNIHWNDEDKRFYFTLFGMSFGTVLGADLSNNKLIIERCISNEYKLCSSSIAVDDKKKKLFLYLCVDIPKKNIELKEDVYMYAMLSVDEPIKYFVGGSECVIPDDEKIYKIGTKDEFLHGRLQIQAALKRAQIAARYNKGGKGRKRKLQSVDRFSDKEKNYVETKLHTYSRMLVDMAAKAGAAKIILIDQKQKEEEAKEKKFILRNWPYFGLIEKIKYKA